jgi:hypothetical protein
MKYTFYEVRSFINDVLAEAKKKGKISTWPHESEPAAPSSEDGSGYQHAEVFDFSKPLGNLNLYHKQGQVNWGPHTGVGQEIPLDNSDSPDVSQNGDDELNVVLRGVVKESVADIVNEDISAWKELAENAISENPWQTAALLIGKK